MFSNSILHPSWKGFRFFILSAIFVGLALTFPLTASAIKVVSEKTITGFKFPESVAYDARNKVLYVSEFVSALKPSEKDGMGRISKVSLDGKILEQNFLPVAGEKLDKPKGIWVRGDRLWVTDIDVVWIFDTKTKKGRKVALPDIAPGTYANDPTVIGKSLFVSDNNGDQVFIIQPADFLNMKGEPKVRVYSSGKGVNPNGLVQGRNGSLLIVGFNGKDKGAGAIYSIKRGKLKKLSKGIGMLDGVYRMKTGVLLVTDWKSGSLFAWSKRRGVQTLAKGFKGPADFAVFPKGKGLMVVVPDLVTSDIRFVQLSR